MTGDMLQDTKDILLVTSYIVIGDIQLNVEISIWMQSRFDGFDFSATLFRTASGGQHIILL